MKSDTQTLIDALRILARDIKSGDGVANACIAEAADRLEELAAGTPWVPVATAPKNGTLVLLWNQGAIEPLLGRYKDGEWRNNHYGSREAYWHCKPSYWQ